jgi:hypothetical protein
MLSQDKGVTYHHLQCFFFSRKTPCLLKKLDRENCYLPILKWRHLNECIFTNEECMNAQSLLFSIHDGKKFILLS